MSLAKINTGIEMPKPEKLVAGVPVKVSDAVRMNKIMRLYKGLFEQTEKNKMSKIWEVDDPVVFVFSYLGEDWEMPVNRIHFFKTYWQTPPTIEWWISFSKQHAPQVQK